MLSLAIREAHQTINDVYSTENATATVTISPGTNPNTEYEYGKDMIARHMYSLNNSAAVCQGLLESRTILEVHSVELFLPMIVPMSFP